MLEMGNPGITKGPSKQVDILMILSAAVNILLALALSVFGSQMYPFFILVYIWIAAYVFFIATLIRRESTSAKPLIQKEVHLVGVIALTILIRSVFLGMSHHISLDSLWYVDFGKFMQMGVVPYTGFYFPYPPVFAGRFPTVCHYDGCWCTHCSLEAGFERNGIWMGFNSCNCICISSNICDRIWLEWPFRTTR
ncbi:MAG: hypothetical protein ACW99X_13355 [Candidatus Thorarchaeota archaeon]